MIVEFFGEEIEGADPRWQEAGQNRHFLLWLNVLRITTFKICGDAAKSRRRGGERGSALLHYHHVSELEK